MPVLAVIALGIVFDDVLPVGLEVDLLAIGAHQPLRLRIERQELALEVAERRAEGGRVRVEIDIDEAAQHLDPHGLEGKLCLVEAVDPVAVTGRAQRAVKSIAPGVVGTGDHRLQAPLALQQAMRAVLTDIIEGAQLPCPVAQDDHALVAHFLGDKVARLG